MPTARAALAAALRRIADRLDTPATDFDPYAEDGPDATGHVDVAVEACRVTVGSLVRLHGRWREVTRVDGYSARGETPTVRLWIGGMALELRESSTVRCLVSADYLPTGA